MTAKSFLTLEDINGTLYSNQGFWWHEIDTWLIGEDEDFDFTKYDFCEIKREQLENLKYKFTVKVNNPYWTKMVGGLTKNGLPLTSFSFETEDENLVIETWEASLKIFLYMGLISFTTLTVAVNNLVEDTLSLNLKQLNTSQDIKYKMLGYSTIYTVSKLLSKGYNLIEVSPFVIGYLFVNLLKTDFQFNCTQSLVVGKVNKVQLGTDSEYKPSGDLVGDYETFITVSYNDKTLPVYWDTTLNDYCFDLDLTNKTNESKIRFNVNVEANDVLNQTSTEVTLNSSYETIDTLAKFTSFINTGGIGRLGADITLTDNITVDNNIYIIGNDLNIDLNGYQFIINENKTFKVEKTIFTNGINTIHQKINTKVELTDCTFVDCTGTGSCIECDIELQSLESTEDFTTVLTGCTFTNNDMCILHGGDLTIQDCNVSGKISDSNYPYFLYQTDGNATILQSSFNISKNTAIATDIKFNSCIFVCGVSALINGLSHSDLQNNNIDSFLDVPQNNQSNIDLTYYYDLIEDYITLQSSKGFTHSASGVDYIFKTGVKPERSD